MKPEYATCVVLDVVDPINDLLEEFFPSALQTTLGLLEASTPSIRHAVQVYRVTRISDLRQVAQQIL